ncbi:bifunctional DNA-formamidopyrimidine glycosylase/DNA-(apurinic or apyrimidinic site) lyase [Arcanobacterium urinimassiliense]|uniref:bifunctional DNA-formamidopyrimidine glycosylase/DNA-(apurinic or apyrimidinic site) lyase n=1 Tax=Arcanobacterium urinimassiliense TaxID=1871014 RepID=UPI00093C2EA7|nr:bifunctional DNA-formamidopyrimidine glycosylase/DNA-(apurinic or apyrimidinic site) lyase [Arcanobacterium urinimassiliense]
MPELPEVETIRRGLLPHVLNKKIVRAEEFHKRVARKSPAGLQELAGKRIKEVARRGKFLWFVLEEENQPEKEALVAHLGMSGQFRINSAPSPHRRAALHLEDGTRLDFIDQRTFGYLLPDILIPTFDEKAGGCGTDLAFIPRSAAHIARDALDPAVDISACVERVKNRKISIKALLLEQNCISGIGNIYADEALYAAQIYAGTAVDKLAAAKIIMLYQQAQEVMRAAIAAGGTSFDALYVHVNGESGYFSRSLQAYGRAGQPCARCGTLLVREKISGRSSYYCPQCQRPR